MSALLRTTRARSSDVNSGPKPCENFITQLVCRKSVSSSSTRLAYVIALATSVGIYASTPPR